MEKEISVIQDRQPRSAMSAVSERSGRLFCLLPHGSGAVEKEGLRVMGVRWREAGARERQAVAGRESPAGVAGDEPRLQPCVFYTCAHEDHSYCV